MMAEETQQKDAFTTLEMEELLDHERLSRALSLDTTLVQPDPNTSLTNLCLICQDNIMRCIRYTLESVDHLVPMEGTQAHSVLQSLHRSLQEDYLRLELWIRDSSVAKGSEYLALGSPIETPIRTALSTIHDQLSLLKELVDDVKNQFQITLDSDKHSFPIELAGQEITRNIRILAQLQSLVHSAQAILFPEIALPGDIQGQVDGVYEAFITSGKLLEPQKGEFMSESDLKTSSTILDDEKARFLQRICEYCGKVFPFGSIDLHRELSHSLHLEPIPSPGIPTLLSPSPSPDIKLASLEGMPSSLTDQTEKPVVHAKEDELSAVLQPHQQSWSSGRPSTPQSAQDLTWKPRDSLQEDTLQQLGIFHFNAIPITTSQIRLLKILPGQTDAPIQSILFTVPLKVFPISIEGSYASPLAETFDYIAVSYAWEQDHEADHRIIIGGDTFRTFFVRSNVHTALRHIRSIRLEVNVWIDAVCIDYRNPEEVTSQMGHIPTIFSRATKALVWLGPAEPNTPETFRFLKEILDLDKLDKLVSSGETPTKWTLVLYLLRQKWFSRRWIFQELAYARDVTLCWGAESMSWAEFVDSLVLFLATKEKINPILRKLARFQSVEDPLGEALTLRAKSFVNATCSLFRKSDDGTIQEKLLTLEYLVTCLLVPFDTSSHKDVIYAALNIAKDTPSSAEMAALGESSKSFDPRVVPNYENSDVDIYVSFVEYCIENSKSLDILCRHWAPVEQRDRTMRPKLKFLGDHDQEIPSWISSIQGHAFGGPEDRLKGRVNAEGFMDSMDSFNSKVYNASGEPMPKVRIVAEHNRRLGDEEIGNTEIKVRGALSILSSRSTRALQRPRQSDVLEYPATIWYTLYAKGFAVCKISELSSRISQGVIQQEVFDLSGWPRGAFVEDIPNHLWRTLVANRGPNGTAAPRWYHRALINSLRHVDRSGDLNTEAVKSLAGAPEMIVSFLERVQQVVWNRRFFQARSKLFPAIMDKMPMVGLADQRAIVGDIVCILKGCRVPVVLREQKTENGSRYFNFVGECYLDRLMDGEAAKYFSGDAEEFPLR